MNLIRSHLRANPSDNKFIAKLRTMPTEILREVVYDVDEFLEELPVAKA